jgi:hypothetical protein
MQILLSGIRSVSFLFSGLTSWFLDIAKSKLKVDRMIFKNQDTRPTNKKDTDQIPDRKFAFRAALMETYYKFKTKNVPC